MSDTPATSSKLRRALRAFREHAVINVAIAGGLTGFMIETGWSPRQYAFAFFSNLAFSVGIATTTSLLFEHGISRIIKPNSPWRWIAFPAALAIGVAIGTEFGLLAIAAVFGDLTHVSRIGIYRVGSIVGLGFLAITLVYDRLRDRMSDQARAVELRAERAQQELLRARVENLQARLNPHFLFNSLNTVAALIEEEPAKAIEAIEKLSELLRYGLDGTKEEEVALGDEVAALEDYLALERLRFGERLRWKINVSSDVRGLAVPSLILQPLVENAVKHGIAPNRRGGLVTVSATVQGASLELIVEDDGTGVSATGGTKLGEASVRERLELLYPQGSSFHAGPGPGGGYRVCIRLPCTDFARGDACAS